MIFKYRSIEKEPFKDKLMNLWAIADLHLSLSCPEKTMEDFGPIWKNYMQRLQDHWKQCVSNEDFVLVPGDITWATSLDQALIDLDYIDKLPGTKILIRGNHDSWWKSIKQMKEKAPKSLHFLQNSAFNHPLFSIAGARLWETSEYTCNEIVEFKPNPKANPKTPIMTMEENDRLYKKEWTRLEMSLKEMNAKAPLKIVMTHFPPLANDLKDSTVHHLLLQYQINICVFGHLHNLKENPFPLFGVKDGIDYRFVAADYLQFRPLKLLSL